MLLSVTYFFYILLSSRNAAIRSLLSVNIPCPPASDSQELKRSREDVPDDKNDTLVDDDTDVELDLEAEGGKAVPDADDRGREGDGPAAVLDHRSAAGGDLGAVKNALSAADIAWQGQTLNGLEFSSQFHLFDQHRHSSQDPGREGNAPPSPAKSVTRKVATLQSRLNAANDTAALLQKLSAHAGFLSTGVTQAEEGEMGVRTNRVIADDDGGNDSSLLSHSVSRPQPLVIGGKGDDEHPRNVFTAAGHGAVKTGSDEESDDDTIEENDDDDDNSVSDEEKDFGEGDVQAQESSLPPNGVGSGGHAAGNANNNSNNNNDKFDFGDEEEWTSGAPQVSSSQLPGHMGRC